MTPKVLSGVIIKVQGINKTIEHEDPSVIDTQSFNADLPDISCDNFREHNLNSKKLKIVMPPRNTRTAAKASGESKIPTAAGTSGPSKSGSSSIPTKLSLPSTRARSHESHPHNFLRHSSSKHFL